MKVQIWLRVFALGGAVLKAGPAAAQYAASVVAYDAGTTPAAGFTTAAAALGEPTRFTGVGAFPGAVTPFNPPYLGSELVSIGEGGQLTLRLSNYLLPKATGPHLGVFTNAGFIETNFPNGRAGNPVGTFGVDSAVVQVSQDGSDWKSLGEIRFDLPTNGYTDLIDPFSTTPGNLPSDFLKPFVGSLNDFNGLQFSLDMLALYDGSAGGTWLDLSGTGLTQVGFVRFCVPDDGDELTSLNFELDGVAISRDAVGTPVPEPGVWAWLLVGILTTAVERLWGRR